MKTSTGVWTLHPAVTGKEAAASTETEAVGVVLAEEGGGQVKRDMAGVSLGAEGTFQERQVRYRGGDT